MGTCVACRAMGRSTAATYVVTVYVAGEEQMPQSSCDAHAILHAVTAIVEGKGVAARAAARRPVPEAAPPADRADPPSGASIGWLARVGRAIRRVRHAFR